MDHIGPSFKGDGEKFVKIKNMVPEDLAPIFSDNLIIRHERGVFHLYFMLNQMPLIMTPEEAQAIEEVVSVCMAHVIVSPEQMERNVKAINENFGRFKDSVSVVTTEKEDGSNDE